MIDNILDVIREELDTFMKLKMGDDREQYVQLVPVVDMEGKAPVTENTVYMSLIRIEEDKINMSDGGEREYIGSKVHFYNPPVKINLYVLFSAAYSDGQEKNYKEAIKRISQVLAFFQAKNVFTTANSPRLDAAVGKLSVDLHNTGMEEQNNLWSMLGSLYRPSVLYRFRALMIQEKRTTAVAGPTRDKDLRIVKTDE